MCFAKSPKTTIIKEQDPVIRQEANANLTKNSKNNQTQAQEANNKTNIFELDEAINTKKKTLLGE